MSHRMPAPDTALPVSARISKLGQNRRSALCLSKMSQDTSTRWSHVRDVVFALWRYCVLVCVCVVVCVCVCWCVYCVLVIGVY